MSRVTRSKTRQLRSLNLESKEIKTEIKLQADKAIFGSKDNKRNVNVIEISSDEDCTPLQKKSPLPGSHLDVPQKIVSTSENNTNPNLSNSNEDKKDEDQELVSNLALDERQHYTVEIFDEWLDTVRTHESHLLSSEEMNYTERYLTLTKDARYLFVRLFLRKVRWLRFSSLDNYFMVPLDENGVALVSSPLEGAVQELVDSGFLNDSTVTQPELEELFDILSLEELRKICSTEIWAKGLKTKNKTTLTSELIRSTQLQPGLLAFGGWGNKNSISNRRTMYIKRILNVLGRLVRVDLNCFLAFERVQIIYLRDVSIEGGAMSRAIRVRIGNIRFPSYEVVRSTEVFKNRDQVEYFYQASVLSYNIHVLLEDKTNPERFHEAWELCKSCHVNWESEIENYSAFTGSYFLLRFTAGWAYTRIMGMGLKALARLKYYSEEENLLKSLLSQTVFRRGKRGDWYVRLSLVQQSHLPNRREGAMASFKTCLEGIRDPYTSPSCLNDLFKRLDRLKNLKQKGGQLLINSALKIPSPGRYELITPPEIILEGERTWSTYLDAGTRMIYRGQDGGEITVEALALDHYVRKGYKGYHCEGGLIATLFGFVFWDLLFSPQDGAFETPYQTAPLDLNTDAFYIDRSESIEELLERVKNGEGGSIITEVYKREFSRQPAAVGVRWDYPLDELVELADCIGGFGLAGILRCMAKQYRDKRAGFPDLTMWHKEESHVRFAEVKGPNDHLSQKQRVWIDTLLKLDLKAELCTIRLVDEGSLLGDISS